MNGNFYLCCYIWTHLFPWLNFMIFITYFQLLDYNVFWCCLVCVCLRFISFLGLWDYNFHEIWTIFAHYVFTWLFFLPPLPLHTHFLDFIKPSDFIPHISKVMFIFCTAVFSSVLQFWKFLLFFSSRLFICFSAVSYLLSLPSDFFKILRHCIFNL